MTITPLQKLQSQFSYPGFKPGQEEAISSLLNGNHTLVVMPTGSGKSLIYQLTALFLPGITLVISPLIALMKDQVDSLGEFGISATYLNSSLPGGEQSNRLESIGRGEYRLVYVSPERLRNVQFLSVLKRTRVSLLAVDEAHCISGWGHDFRPDYLHISRFSSEIGSPLIAALTATATPQVQQDIIRTLGLGSCKSIVTGFNRPNLALEVLYIADPIRKLSNLQRLLASRKDGTIIVYTGTRRDAEEINDFVSTAAKTRSAFYHAGLPAEQRTQIQNSFMAGTLPVVVATNAFGMGIDRPDVHHVIHYSIPGSIEAYYQEAGRAGRDGLPAKATLLYAPDDRALQEYFIENSVLSIKDLRTLFACLDGRGDHNQPTTIEAISVKTGLPEIKIRVGLAELEAAGIIGNEGVEGFNIRVQVHPWNEANIQSVDQHYKQHQKHREKQLAAVIEYAESNACRRQIIMDYFGDSESSRVEVCCDNCQSREKAKPATIQQNASQLDLFPLVILDTIRRLNIKVGQSKIEKILLGSRAKDIISSGYDKNVYYGRLLGYPRSAIHDALSQLIQSGYIKVIGGKYPVLRLTPQGENAIKNRDAIQLNLPQSINNHGHELKRKIKKAGGTVKYTLQLFSEGHDVEQVAKIRGLTRTTIYGHCAKLIADGQLAIDRVVPEDIHHQVEDAIQKVGAVDYLTPIKEILPEEIDYNVIRCVVEYQKHRGSQPTPDGAIAEFLAQARPRQLPGAWLEGWALGFHSQFSGADWKRSEVGELAFNLKYRGDLSTVPRLVDHACALLKDHPKMTQVDGVVPVPPSATRANDPVGAFAKALSDRLGLRYSPLLAKSRETSAQKSMHTLAQKKANVLGAFKANAGVAGKQLLVIDDLYDSGATLEEICRLLKRCGVAGVYVLTLTRTIHTDA